MENLAAANVNRAISLAATNISIFTFTLMFLYPKFEKGTVQPVLFQAALIAMAISTFSLVFATVHYYRSSLGAWVPEHERSHHARRAETFWALGYSVMFLTPSLVLFSIGLLVVAAIWLTLWLVYLIFVIHSYPKALTPRVLKEY
ncbi:MAG TPA: hypothetical protein VL137_10430 [Polyangiaceae bacterium]|nr:hypothetical protein [Polyangiaceae bacterium]